MTEPTTKNIEGYTPVSDSSKDLVNANKRLEEIILRTIDALETLDNVDKESLGLGKIYIQQGFMWINRSIFKPTRIDLDK